MAFDGLALLASYFLSLLLRYDSAQVIGMLGWVAAFAVAAVAFQWVVGMILRIYSGRVAVASIEETILLGLTTVGGGTLLGIANMVGAAGRGGPEHPVRSHLHRPDRDGGRARPVAPAVGERPRAGNARPGARAARSAPAGAVAGWPSR